MEELKKISIFIKSQADIDLYRQYLLTHETIESVEHIASFYTLYDSSSLPGDFLLYRKLSYMNNLTKEDILFICADNRILNRGIVKEGEWSCPGFKSLIKTISNYYVLLSEKRKLIGYNKLF